MSHSKTFDKTLDKALENVPAVTLRAMVLFGKGAVRNATAGTFSSSASMQSRWAATSVVTSVVTSVPQPILES